VEVLRVEGDDPAAASLDRALAILGAGGLLIYPTDTLYAIGGRAQDPSVAEKVRAAKGRETKPLPLIAADVGQVDSLATALTAEALRLADRFWPGPLTLILPARPEVPDGVTAGTGTVAVRVPALVLARRLCQRAGPLVSTSANLSGGPSPVTCAEAVAAVGPAVTLALDAGPGRPVASTIVDVTGRPARLVRSGAVPWAEVLASLQAG
jgi:L-threonylcarbamoyladenylate synthase